MGQGVVVVLSGGMDSATLLYYMLRLGHEVKALSVNYGQRHVKELEYARDLCQGCKVEHKILDLSVLRNFLAGSALTSDDVPVPEGHYTEESMKSTVVPNRNMILLSLAAGWALSLDCVMVAYAAHAGDHALYPDCRPEFVEAFTAALALADCLPVQLVAPFINLTKEQIVRLGESLQVPYRCTWSCYSGGEKHCGKCGTCVERVLAFKEAGVPDPTEYEDSEYALGVDCAES